MSADILIASGAGVALGPPAADEKGNASVFLGYAAVRGGDEIVTLTASNYDPNGQSASEITATAYDLNGSLAFRTVLFDTYAVDGPPIGLSGADMALLANGDVVIGWNQIFYSSQAGNSNNDFAIVSPAGAVADSGAVTGNYSINGRAALYATATGFDMAWNTETSPFSGPQKYEYQTASFDLTGQAGAGTSTSTGTFGGYDAPYVGAHALAPSAWGPLQLSDNTVQFYDHTGTIPGEPAHAITSEAGAMLADGVAAVAWVDSGTDYVSIFNAAANSFGPVIGLDWGGASDVHVVALPDGGFAVSWMNGGAYKGELFDGAGNGGGIISLTGDVAGIANNGDLYTVGLNSSGQYVVQEYAIGSSGGGTTGQTFTSDDNGDHWTGTAGDDTFNLGRGGDYVTGNGGNDTYRFAAIPWAGGHITDFNAGDVLDLTGLMSTTSDKGPDGFADGYLKITGNQVWANYQIPGNDGWWLVETLDGVAPSSLTHTGDVITIGSAAGGGGGGSSDVTTADASYTAPANVTAITLTGSQQHIDASATNGVTITSNDTGNVLIGGAGDDVFHLGRGGDWVAGGAGADSFAYAATPWAGGGITDFNASEGDKVDVSGLLQASGYTGSDPFADGYLQLTSDSSGNAQLWSDIHQPGNDGWWLVATLDGVSTSSLHYSGGLIT